MKYLMIFCHGLADEPIADMGARTPFELAKTPNLDRLAKEGKAGLVSLVPHDLPVAPDVACFSLLGYDPREFYTGLAPLDALAMGAPQDERAVAFRSDLVTVLDETLQDPTAGGISAKESKLLIDELNHQLANDRVRLYAGGGYKNILMINDPATAEDLDDLETTPPSRLVGQKYVKSLPRGRGEGPVTGIMRKSKEILDGQEINRVRIDLKENPANMLWLWGQGRKPKLPPFKERAGVRGAVVSDEDFVRGLAIAAGLETAASVRAALKGADFVFRYFVSPATSAELKAKVKCIEQFDHEVGAALRALEGAGEVRVCAGTDSVFSASPDKPIAHASTPFVLWGPGVEASGSAGFSEKTAELGRFSLAEGHQLIGHLIQKRNGRE